MTDRVLLDTGPLVAFLCAGDEFHDWTVARLKELRPPFLTCEAVLSETCFVLDHEPAAMEQLATLLARGWIRTAFDFADEADAVMTLLRRYHSVPMSFADACLVRMAELHEGQPVFTLDRDFRVYRKNGRQVIPLICPR
ncbi:MAG: PIN domain-containing protein [Verrucomicrobia bacterium]|nr:PIN domain-containing protein [Verrucomicrobiota bacterium]